MNEFRSIVFALVFILVSQAAWSQNSKTFSFVHGMEWGSTLNYYYHSYSLFLTQDQFLAERKSNGFSFHANGFLNYGAGVSLRKMEALLYAGIQGFDKGIQTLPIGIRTMAHVRDDMTGFFGFIDGNVGIPVKKMDKSTTYCAIGIGWRIRISKRLCIDHMIGISDAIVSPTEVYDPYSDCIVKPQDLRESRSNRLGIRLSASLRL